MSVALKRAFEADRIAAFGGAVVVNRKLDLATAELINSVYFEVVAAPEFDDDALAELKKKKNLRILRIPGILELEKLSRMPFLDIKSLSDGGMVLQFSFRNAILSVDDFIPPRPRRTATSSWPAPLPNRRRTTCSSPGPWKRA